ncbi:hypothetical protein U1Q18_008654 [Sarracenia purpurea var. burkii]
MDSSSSFSSPEFLSDHRKKAIQELIRGHDLAKQLRVIIGGANGYRGHDRSLSADDIVTKILASFIQTISILNCSTTDAVSQIPADGLKFDDSGESRKASVVKDRRRCFKKSRKASETCTRLAPTLIDDGHSWRKYGQKVIFNAKHPRSYYRCTHKYEQGCQATKQVQKTEDYPPMYRITYHAHHTCKNPIQYPDRILLDSAPPGDSSSILLSFGSNHPNNNSHDSFLPTIFPWTKQKYKEDNSTEQISLSIEDSQPLSPPPAYDYLLSPDLKILESSGPITMLSSGSDHGDVISSGVYSCTASTTHSQSLDLDDMMVGAVDFDDFEFLNCELLLM